MSRMIQIRNVPDAIHAILKSRAALAGQSLSDYLLDILRRDSEVPTREEMLERLRRLPPLRGLPSAAKVLRSERKRRDAQLARSTRQRTHAS